MQLQERATGARFDLSPLPIGIPDSSQKRPFRFRSGDCESNVRLVSHQEAPRRRRWREVSEAGCEISGGEKVFSRSFASFRGHVLAVYSLRRLPREWPKSTQIALKYGENVDGIIVHIIRLLSVDILAIIDALRAPPAPRARRRLTPLQVDFSQDVTVTAIHLFTSKFHVRPRRGQCRLTSSRF